MLNFSLARIIDEDLFNLVQQRLNACKKSKMQYVYKGLVFSVRNAVSVWLHIAGQGAAGRFIYIISACLVAENKYQKKR